MNYGKNVISGLGIRKKYMWIEAISQDRQTKEQFLVPQNFNARIEFFDPFENPNMFLEFSRLGYNLDHILKFADRYGTLGFHESFDLIGTNPNPKTASEFGESARCWYDEIIRMSETVDLWKAIGSQKDVDATQDHDFLNTRIKRRKADANTFGYQGKTKTHYVYVQDFFTDFDKLHTEDQARMVLCQLLNNNLHRTQNDNYHIVGVNVDLSGSNFVLRVNANSLLACMWLQFAQAVSGQSTIANCKRCDNWFVVGGRTSKHKDRMYCDEPECRKNAKKKTPSGTAF